MRPVAVVVVRMAGASVRREVEKSIGASAGEVFALLEARIDDRDADLVTVVSASSSRPSADDEEVLELVVVACAIPASMLSALDDGVDRDGLDIRIGFEGQQILAVNGRGERLEPPVSDSMRSPCFLRRSATARRPARPRAHDDALADLSPVAAALRSTRSSLDGLRFGRRRAPD